MDNKFLCVMAGYDDNTEEYLTTIQNRLYEKDFVGTHTKNLPQHITLGTFSIEKERELVNLVKRLAMRQNRLKLPSTILESLADRMCCL